MTVLVTGGAGFIGSNLVDALLGLGERVRVLDDTSTGSPDNLNSRVEIVDGDVADETVVREAMEGVHVVFHEAAHRSVISSVEHPLTTDHANTHGTLTILAAARDAGVRRVVYASSSSVYGGSTDLPTPEGAPLWPRSPYAVTKLAGEHYCRVFSELYGLETVALRYFNVYGPRQRPDSAYAAVIPLFIRALAQGERPVVHGDGLQSRDFTYVDDVVAGNLAAAAAAPSAIRGKVFNIACGGQHSILELLKTLGDVMGTEPAPVHGPARKGDIRHSLADVTAAQRALGFKAGVTFEEGLRTTAAWITERL